MRVSAFAVASLIALAGCAQRSPGPVTVVETPPPPTAPPPEPSWRTVVRPDDDVRLDDLHQTWRRAVAAAETTRSRSGLAAEADLLDPAAALDHPAMPPGPYRCRFVKLGERGGPDDPSFRAYRPFFCYVESDGIQLTLTKQTGTDLPAGWLYQDGGRRYVFLGTAMGGASAQVAGYGSDATRDVVGIAERIGPFRWRLVLPARDDRARLSVLELIPSPPDIRDPLGGVVR